MARAFYNEIDPFAVAWLQKLEAEGHIAKGDVDARDIRTLEPRDVGGATQAHFFAGIGGWSHALRLAGWADDAPVWTGSCPCQPFSAAGKKRGLTDERHLWPDWFRLIRECRPTVIFGEQVASAEVVGRTESKGRHADEAQGRIRSLLADSRSTIQGEDGGAWFDVVSADLESEGYTVGAAVLLAAGVGAPHLRQRLYFVAYALEGRRGNAARALSQAGWARRKSDADGDGTPGVGLADTDTSRLSELGRERLSAEREPPQRNDADGRGEERVGDAEAARRNGGAGSDSSATGARNGPGDSSLVGDDGSERATAERAGGEPRRTFWSDCDWIPCRDGKARPVEPGTFPLASGVPARVGRLRGYGNSVVAPLAAEFVRAAMEVLG